MKVNKRKVITKILSYMLVMAMMIGLMPGAEAKAADATQFYIGKVIGWGEKVTFDGNIYIQYSKVKSESVGYTISSQSGAPADGEFSLFGKEYGEGSESKSFLTFASTGTGGTYDIAVRNAHENSVKVVKGTGSQGDPYVFEAITSGSSSTENDSEDSEDKKSFDAEKTAQKASADALLKSDDSDSCKKLVSDAKDAIDKTEYDSNKTLDENKAALKAIVDKLKTDLEAQRESEKAASGSGSDGKEEETHPDGTKTVTEIKTENGKNTITVTDYDKGGQQTAQFIYEGTKGDTLELRTVNFSGKNLKVPDTVKGGGKTYKVTRLRKNFMKKCKKAKKLDVGKNVSQIDKGALNGGKKLETVIIRGKLKKVGRGAFKSMKKGTIKIKGSKKTFEKNKKLLEKSGINPNVKFKRVKNSKK